MLDAGKILVNILMRRMRVLTRIFPASSIVAAQLTTEKGSQ